MRSLLSLLFIGLISVPAGAAELTSRERRMVDAVNATLRKAGTDFAAGKYEASADSVRRAMKQIEIAVKAGSGELHDATRSGDDPHQQSARDAGIGRRFAAGLSNARNVPRTNRPSR